MSEGKRASSAEAFLRRLSSEAAVMRNLPENRAGPETPINTLLFRV